MGETRHSAGELEQMQALPLDIKVKMTKRRIQDWYEAFDGNVYVSFSGGKDSTVLLHIAREIYPDIRAMYIDTGLEFPEIRKFVMTFPNVDITIPDKNFTRVIREYGYPIFGKEIAKIVNYARKYKKLLDDGIPNEKELYRSEWIKLNGIEPYGKDSLYTKVRYQFMLKAPFNVSERCCAELKKKCGHKYEKETGLKRITGQMASESFLRKMWWMKIGCNSFEGTPTSNPMAFWTDADVLQYIKENGIRICEVYGEVVGDGRKIRSTGCERTGCFACGFGIHREKQEKSRILNIMNYSNPNLVDWMMRGGQFDEEDGLWKPKGGLGLAFVYEWINIAGGFNIWYPDRDKYLEALPREAKEELERAKG